MPSIELRAYHWIQKCPGNEIRRARLLGLDWNKDTGLQCHGTMLELLSPCADIMWNYKYGLFTHLKHGPSDPLSYKAVHSSGRMLITRGWPLRIRDPCGNARLKITKFEGNPALQPSGCHNHKGTLSDKGAKKPTAGSQIAQQPHSPLLVLCLASVAVCSLLLCACVYGLRLSTPTTAACSSGTFTSTPCLGLQF